MRRTLGLGAVLVLLAGCGSNADGRTNEQAPIVVWADSDLRSIVDQPTVGGKPVKVTLLPSQAIIRRLDAGSKRPDVLLVQADTFPIWDESADRLRDSRVVATDPFVLVTRKPHAVPHTLETIAGERLAIPRKDVEGTTAYRAVMSVPRRDRPTRRVRLPHSTDVLQALRDGKADVGLVPRSVVRRAADAARFNQARLVGTKLNVQTAYSADHPRGRAVVPWLASRAGQRRFKTAGFGPPGPNARPNDCSADPSEPCKPRP
jgi:ABC-type amino acid transport substrate-binding protein